MGKALLRRSVAKALERKRQGFGLRPTKSEGKGGGKGNRTPDLVTASLKNYILNFSVLFINLSVIQVIMLITFCIIFACLCFIYYFWVFI